MDKHRINGVSFFNHKTFRTTLYFAILGFIYLFTHPSIYLLIYLMTLYFRLNSVKCRDDMLVKKLYKGWKWLWANLINSPGIF